MTVREEKFNLTRVCVSVECPMVEVFSQNIKPKIHYMPNVWKVGSRWGFGGPSNLDLFMSYQCAFFGLDAYRIGKWEKAEKGDLLLVCNGSKPVAIGIMQSKFGLYHDPESTIKFCKRDYDEWIGGRNDFCICKARYCLIPEDDNEEWGNDGMKRFCLHTQKDIVIQKWREYNEKESMGEFEIESRTVSLIASRGMPGIFSPNTRYRIPVYQRPYSWGENELRRLMEDLREAFSHKEPAFMGTVQLSSRMPLWTGKNNECFAFDIVDGQQRTSTFLLLRSILEERIGKIKKDGRDKQYITHVNKGSAQCNLDEFWEVWNAGNLTERTYSEGSNNPYLSNAYCLNSLIDEYFGDKESNSAASPEICEKLLAFIHSQLRFVVIETKAGLSKTLKIFNTINTTGLGLGTADIFKLRLYEYLKDASDAAFDDISRLYERVDNHLKENTSGIYYSMEVVLGIYQRILIAQYNLRSDLYWYSVPRFFECLFDTLLGVRNWQGFPDRKSVDLSVESLNRVVDCLNAFSEEYEKNEELRIIHGFIGETRYKKEAINFSVIAMYFHALDIKSACKFETHLFKLLVPPSLYWAKVVSAVQYKLVDILKEIATNTKSNGALCVLESKCKDNFEKGNAQEQVKAACGYAMAAYLRWKNLTCKLCEYLTVIDAGKTPSYDSLFGTSFDIEHIQSYVDNVDSEKTRNEWGEEINRLGNLVMFESSKNRSVRNETSKKPDAYRSSQYETVKELAEKVALWSLQDAVERRVRLTTRIVEYLFSNSNLDK